MLSLNQRLLRREQRRRARTSDAPAPKAHSAPAPADLKADLAKLAGVSDDDLRREARRIFVEKMAAKFVVPVALMEVRLEGVGPFLARPAPEAGPR